MIEFDATKEIPVMEHFYTIQGEGFFAGTAAYFIRLAGCDVACHWCDVKESWEVYRHQLMDINLLVSEIKKTSAKLVVITGGEPLMYNIDTLVKLLQLNDYKVNIETSGTYDLTCKVDWLCVSPKKFKAVLPSVLTQANELKIIIYNNSDFKFAEENLKLYNQHTTNRLLKCYLQVEWSVREKMTSKVVEYVKNNPTWNISVQTHKYLQIP